MARAACFLVATLTLATCTSESELASEAQKESVSAPLMVEVSASSPAAGATPKAPTSSAQARASATAVVSSKRRYSDRPDPVESAIGPSPGSEDSKAFERHGQKRDALRRKREQALAAKKLRPGEATISALREDPFVRDAFAERSQQILEAPDELRLYSVSWNMDSLKHGMIALNEGREPNDTSGSVVLSPADATMVVSYLYSSAAIPDASWLIGCDNPHHALVATKEGERVVIAVCFECSHLNVLGLDGFERVRSSWKHDVAFHRLLNAKLEAGGVPVNGPLPR